MRAPWTWPRAAAIAIGGASGAALRWAVVTSFTAGQFPWPVFAINIAGSVLLGVLLAEEWSHPTHRLLLHDFGGIGVCGGLTTFSTFSLEVVDLVRDGHAWTAATYAVLSVAAALIGVVAGAVLLRRLRALTLPLEERP
jgi:CrcB protein